MKIKTKLGELQVNRGDILEFKQGIIAFDRLKKFFLLNVTENPLFKWLQSLEEPDVAFLLVDPFLLKKDYALELDDFLQSELEIEKKEEVVVYTIVTVPGEGFKSATTNLVGPIIINLKKKKGKQVILEQDGLSIKYPLFPQNSINKISCGGQ